MPLKRAKALVFVIAMGVLETPAYAAEPEIKPLLNFSWRHEFQDTVSSNADLDNKYDFGSLRLRFGLDVNWERFSIHALGQAAGAYSLPANGSGGIGRIYFGASGGEETSPSQIAFAELSATFKPTDGVSLTGGRIGIKDGLGKLTGNGRFDWIKKARLSERLVGTWDWVTVGRRYDGASVAVDREQWHLSGYGARVLQGGVDFDDAFKHLDGVDVFGFEYTSKQDRWLRSSEINVFNHLYRDSRPLTESNLGQRLLVNSIGTSLVGIYPTGPGAVDLMLWLAYQFGDYGNQSHSALGFIAEAGYGWTQVKGAPWLRAGIARSSGDGNPGDDKHGTFFNKVPTNHKWYGYQDLSAFQNLTNFYGQFRVSPYSGVGLTFDAHLFRLTETADAWYAGSGPPNNNVFGYAARRPSDGSDLDSDIGWELDFTTSWNAHPRASFQFGASYFGGSDAARTMFPVKSNFTWAYVQAVLRY